MIQFDPKLVRFDIDSYVRAFFGGHNLGNFYARKLKLGMHLTQTKTFNSILELLLGPALG